MNKISIIPQIGAKYMSNIVLEIIFWIFLTIYVGARFIQTKKGYEKQY